MRIARSPTAAPRSPPRPDPSGTGAHGADHAPAPAPRVAVAPTRIAPIPRRPAGPCRSLSPKPVRAPALQQVADARRDTSA